jgi:hypothetical protein
MQTREAVLDYPKHNVTTPPSEFPNCFAHRTSRQMNTPTPIVVLVRGADRPQSSVDQPGGLLRCTMGEVERVSRCIKLHDNESSVAHLHIRAVHQLDTDKLGGSCCLRANKPLGNL